MKNRLQCHKTTVSVTFFENFYFMVDVSVAPADPDVGISEPYVEEWIITEVDGCQTPEVIAFFTAKIEEQENATPGQTPWLEAVEEAVAEDYGSEPDYYRTDERKPT